MVISQEYELEFLGNNFDKIVNLLSEAKAEEIYRWAERIMKEEIQPILTKKSKKRYKQWLIHDLLSFRKEVGIERTHYRVLLIKVKNSFYIEFHLSDHNYYDKLRKKLDLTYKNY